ncbi:unnamed protein product [Prunus brigantina]
MEVCLGLGLGSEERGIEDKEAERKETIEEGGREGCNGGTDTLVANLRLTTENLRPMSVGHGLAKMYSNCVYYINNGHCLHVVAMKTMAFTLFSSSVVRRSMPSSLILVVNGEPFRGGVEDQTQKGHEQCPRALRRLRTCCERAKRTLSCTTTQTTTIEWRTKALSMMFLLFY